MGSSLLPNSAPHSYQILPFYHYHSQTPSMLMAAPVVLRWAPLLRLRLLLLHQHRSLAVSLSISNSRSTSSSAEPPLSDGAGKPTSFADPPNLPRWDDPDNIREWKKKKEEIIKDMEPIIFLAKDILHSNRYADGERLTKEDEKIVVDRILSYHPQSEDKIGCGLDFIMVDRHPQFKVSRCLFAVRRDGGWIDFSYQKCLRTYIRYKYPSHADRFIKEHFKRGSS